MKLVYNVNDRPPVAKIIVFALQQLLAILAATILVPMIVGNGMSTAAALFGAGAGTIVYLLFTKFRSPVFLGSSFAFIGSMCAAFAGGVSASAGYLGVIIGAVLAGLVYVIIALVIKLVGTGWIEKIMPPQVVGPTVAIIGLSLSVNAIKDAVGGNLGFTLYDSGASAWIMTTGGFISLICALVTFVAIVLASVKGNKTMKLIPFIIGIGAGYVVAALFTVFGYHIGGDASFKIIDFAAFANMKWLPDFAFLGIFKEPLDFAGGDFWAFLGTIAVAYVPVAFVVFAEHLADHKNLSSIIEKDLTKDPGLDKTLLGDGIGSMVGAFFGGCANTTYGESVGCVAISKNASIVTIFTTAIMAMVISFIAPIQTLLASIPSPVMGGACIALYGFIAVSGLKMIQKVDLEDNANLFTVSSILILGVGGMALQIGAVKLTSVACALILGIVINAIVSKKCKCCKCADKADDAE